MSAPEADDPVEEILATCLAAEDPAAALQAALAAHPQHAAEVQARWDFLAAAAAPGTGRNGLPAGRLGRFRILGKIGGGGMGVVYRALEDPPGRDVALKLVRPEQLWFEGARKRFVREVETVAAMQHPGVVPIYSCGEQDGVPYYAMELVRGHSLADVLTMLRAAGTVPDAAALHQPGARDWNDACFRVALQVAEALAYVHKLGVVHRDIKPSNVMLDDAGRARLIDFGLARSAGAESMTRTGVQPGSLAYMSPEQVRGEDVDERTDVWSLGVTLHELLTLHQPFVGSSEEATRRAILAGHVPRLASSGYRLPWDAATVVATAMAPERERRYRSMAMFAADLRAFLERRPITARRPGPWLRARRWLQRHPVAAAIGALGIALFGVLPSALLWNERAARVAIAQEASRANREAESSRRVVEFLQGLFYEVDPQRARGATVPVRVILDRGVKRIRDELTQEPAVRAALLGAMGAVYLNLGLLAEGVDLLREELRVRESVLQQTGRALWPTRFTLARGYLSMGRSEEAQVIWRGLLAEMEGGPGSRERAKAQAGLAQCAWRLDRLQEARQLFDAAIAELGRLVDPDHIDLLIARQARGRFLLWRVDPDAGRRELEDVQSRFAATLDANHPLRLQAVADLAGARNETGDPALSVALLEESIQKAAAVFDPAHPVPSVLREELAKALLNMGRAAEGLKVLETAMAANAATFASPHFVLARGRNLESSLAFEAGDLARAERAARAALADYEQLFPEGSHDFAVALANLSRVLMMLGHVAEAEDLARRSEQMLERVDHLRSEPIAYAKSYLAYALALQNRVGEAQQAAAAAHELVEGSRDVRARAHVACYGAEVLLMAKQPAQGLEMARQAEETWRAIGSEAGACWARYLQGWACNELGKGDEAETILRHNLAERRRLHPPGHLYIALSAGELGVTLARRKQLEEAETLLAEAVAIRRQASGPRNPFLALPLLNLSSLEARLGRSAKSVELGLEALAILRANGLKKDRLVDPAVQILLGALRAMPASEARTRALADLRESAEQLGASEASRAAIAAEQAR